MNKFCSSQSLANLQCNTLPSLKGWCTLIVFHYVRNPKNYAHIYTGTA